MNRTKLSLLLFVLVSALAFGLRAEKATLSWNANTETDLAGYKVYKGSASGALTVVTNLGLQTSYVVDSLVQGQRVYFAVSAVNTFGLESPLSTEVAYDVPVNLPPVAHDASKTTIKDTAITITLSATDPEGAALTFAITTPPSHGTLTSAVSGASFIYRPATGYVGPDSFSYTANDGKFTSAPATVSITVVDKPAAPVNFKVVGS